MTDWMNRPKALDRFAAQDKRMDALEKRLDEFGIDLRREVARLEPKTTVQLPGGDIDETVRTVTVDEEKDGRIVLDGESVPMSRVAHWKVVDAATGREEQLQPGDVLSTGEPASIPAKDRDDPEAVHLLQGLAGEPTGKEEEAGMWCGLAVADAARWGTVPVETTCKVCMERWAAAVKVRGLPSYRPEPDGTV